MAQSLQDPVNKLIENAEKKEQAQKEGPEDEPQQPEQLISLDVENPAKPASSAEDGKNAFSAFEGECTHVQCSGTIDELLDLKPAETGASESEVADKDDMQLLNDILNASCLDEGDFSKEWTAVFGNEQIPEPTATSAPGEPEAGPPPSSSFLPSQLLDKSLHDLQSLQGWRESPGSPTSTWKPAAAPKPPGVSSTATPVKEPEKNARDLTAWFSLFADLDPLSNPDAVGRTDKEHELLNA